MSRLTPTMVLRAAPFGAISRAEIPGDDAGVLSGVVRVGTGTGRLEVAGYPVDTTSFVVRVVQIGDIGDASVAVSTDGGTTFGQAILTRGAPQEFLTVPFVRDPEWKYEVPLAGVVLRFINDPATPGSSFIAGDTYVFSSTASPRFLLHCQAADDEYCEWFRNHYQKPEVEDPSAIAIVHMANIVRWRLTAGRGLDEFSFSVQKEAYKQACEFFKNHSDGSLTDKKLTEGKTFVEEIQATGGIPGASAVYSLRPRRNPLCREFPV